MSDLVKNHEDRFSCDVANFVIGRQTILTFVHKDDSASDQSLMCAH